MDLNVPRAGSRAASCLRSIYTYRSTAQSALSASYLATVPTLFHPGKQALLQLYSTKGEAESNVETARRTSHSVKEH